MGRIGRILASMVLAALVSGAFVSDAIAQANRKVQQSAASRRRKVAKAVDIVEAPVVNNALASTDAVLASDPGAASTVAAPLLTPQELETDLFDRFLACSQQKCEGDVPWEKCFGSGKVKTAIMTDPNCKSYYDSSNATVRTNSISRLEETIKGYFDEACKMISSDAKIMNGRCQVPMYYHAVDGDGKVKRFPSMNFYPGQSVMCSYVTFGIDGKQLEWKQSKNDDVEYQAAKWNLIAKGVNAGVNAIATSVNIYQDNKKGKELAKVQGTFVYEFNGKTLTKKYECATVDYTGGNSKVGCVDGGTLKPDDAGQKYCLIPVENPVDYCSTILPAQSCDSLDNKCEFDKEGKLNCTCFVKIEDVSGAKVEEKANSLIKQAGLLDAAKMQIGMGQMNLQMNSMMYQAGNTALMNQAMNSFGTNNTNTTKQKCNRTSAITFTNDVVNSGQPEVYYDSCQPAGCNYNGTQSICTKYCIPTTQNCQKGTDGEWYVGSGTETNVTGFNVKQFSTNIKGVSDSATDIYSAVNTANMGAMKSIQSAAAVGSSYTDNQAAVNKQEQQVAAVEQSKNQNMNNVVQLIAGKEGLFGIITDKVAMDMAYDSKGQQMTGFCYIGDPNKGSGVPFARENESKRLGWMN